MRTVHTSRLTLEPQAAQHAEAMFAVLGDPAIYEFENEPPQSVDALRARYAYLESRRSPDGTQQWLNWVVRLAAPPPGVLIGYVQATLYADARAAVAYEFASAWWRRGLASEAVRAMNAELAAHHGVQRLTAVLKANNQRSLRLLERLGFAPATAAERAALEVASDELLLTRPAQPPAG